MIAALLVTLAGYVSPIQSALARQETRSMQKVTPHETSPTERQDVYEDAAMPYLPEGSSGSAEQSPLERTRQRHEQALMAIDGVVGVGIGRTSTGDEAILVYVKDASVKKRIPTRLEGFPVEPSVSGEIDAYGGRRP
jgi:hypothetical protein